MLKKRPEDMLKKDLRDYQISAINDVISSEGNKIVLIPTGTGKSLTLAHIAKHYSDRRTLVIAPSREIVSQLDDELKNLNVSATVMTIQKLVYNNYYLKIQVPELLLVDEIHKIGGEYAVYRDMAKHFVDNGARIIGFTGTLERYDTLSILENGFFTGKDVICPITVKEAIERGILSKPIYHLLDVKEYADPYETEISQLTKALKLILDTDHKHILIFCRHMEDIKLYGSIFINELKFNPLRLHGNLPKTARANVLDEFRRGDNRVLLSINVITTGIDLPFVDAIVFLRNVKSIGLYKQIIGRGLRKVAGKTCCHVYDFVGVTANITDINEICTVSHKASKRKHPTNYHANNDPTVIGNSLKRKNNIIEKKKKSILVNTLHVYKISVLYTKWIKPEDRKDLLVCVVNGVVTLYFKISEEWGRKVFFKFTGVEYKEGMSNLPKPNSISYTINKKGFAVLKEVSWI